MDIKHEHPYNPNQPLPQRDPMRAMADWGMPPNPPVSPGRPYEPSRVEQELAVQHGWSGKRRGLPAWAWVSIVLGSILLCGGSLVSLALVGESGPVPGRSADPAPAAVTTSGTCEKKIVGEYGLVATIIATNSTNEDQTGVLWVRWPITGEAAQEFTKRATIKPGQAVELVVNQKVVAERWFRIGECSYGWTPSS